MYCLQWNNGCIGWIRNWESLDSCLSVVGYESGLFFCVCRGMFVFTAIVNCAVGRRGSGKQLPYFQDDW